MSFNVPKGLIPRQRTNEEKILLPETKPASYGQIGTAHQFKDGIFIECEVCGDYHSPQKDCKSKPEYPPSAYYSQCDICIGFHPKGRCWFEYLRPTLFTLSHCERCQLPHIGFCKSALFCQVCNTKHNFKDGCTRQVDLDLSKNECPRCGLNHTLHCPSELVKIQTNLVLYCNRCKLEHAYMRCTPFCLKCFTNHAEGMCYIHIESDDLTRSTVRPQSESVFKKTSKDEKWPRTEKAPKDKIALRVLEANAYSAEHH